MQSLTSDQPQAQITEDVESVCHKMSMVGYGVNQLEDLVEVALLVDSVEQFVSSLESKCDRTS